MARTIKLKYQGECIDCSRSLEPGDYGRWIGRGRRQGPGLPGRRLVSRHRPDFSVSPPQSARDHRKPIPSDGSSWGDRKQPKPVEKPVEKPVQLTHTVHPVSGLSHVVHDLVCSLDTDELLSLLSAASAEIGKRYAERRAV